MRVSVVTIPAPAEWINSNDRLHYRPKAKLTAAWREAARLAVKALGFDPRTEPVRIVAHVWKPRGGRWDPGNWYPTAKACVDGLVDSGFLVDDDHEHVVGPDMRRGGKGRDALVLTIEEIVP